ncbi:citrate/2-methylcitrate synthase [Myxococcus sp. RHSTA-1-4]|uniref:citrate/2-methylcitrate synthase n=1 Tax=Myxococcus sp. RHSTA-1-4 TaxID=2874601 RepID=UPI001CBFE083|nr:citrate/2-methylcitrate synthase [Myxococcus sp. RHSTA-1-4]MBZ4420765.1 helix-turn-helix domain-containing protein [Myxococcus sp. RHSTA-1-4]
MSRRKGGRSQSRFDHQREEELVPAAEAAALLGVKRATLYTYVSRGLVRCVPEPGTKENRYVRSDLERLKARHDARAGHAAVASGALRWGEPVIDSSVSRVGAEGLAYRGQPAVALAVEGRGFEDVAELLWTGTLPPEAVLWPAPEPSFPPSELARLLPRGTPPVAALSALVTLLGARDPVRFAAPPESEKARARRLLRHLAAWVCVAQAPGRVVRALKEDTVAASLACAWGTGVKRAPALLNRALVLCADHELNVSTFAARVTASSGADLYACVSAALAALSGPKHGGSCDRVEALLAEVGRPERATEVVYERLRRGESVPGFGHPLYPDGDPRTPPLVEAAQSVRPEAMGVRVARSVLEVMRKAGHPPPSVDFGLVMLAEALGLPPGAGATLFAVGRAAGWVAHVLEQREQGHLLRPRARYVEPALPSSPGRVVP